jgi:hypothetical protein
MTNDHRERDRVARRGCPKHAQRRTSLPLARSSARSKSRETRMVHPRTAVLRRWALVPGALCAASCFSSPEGDRVASDAGAAGREAPPSSAGATPNGGAPSLRASRLLRPGVARSGLGALRAGGNSVVRHLALRALARQGERRGWHVVEATTLHELGVATGVCLAHHASVAALPGAGVRAVGRRTGDDSFVAGAAGRGE